MFPRVFLIVSLIFFIYVSLGAQQVITLQNPSFEDMPRKGAAGMPSIKGWHDCGLTSFPSESPPDIHPVPATAWEVSKHPYDGLTFLGMVVRYNDSQESLSQALSSPLEGGTCYSFSAFIAKSELYKSGTTRYADSVENFDRPAVLQIWGGNSFCQRSELLGESPGVSNHDWKLYKFLLQPRKSYRFITIAAFYKTPILEAYNGHVLVDNLSDIISVECPLMPQDIIAKVSDPPVQSYVAQNSGGSNTTTYTRPKTGSPKTTPQTSLPKTNKVFKADLLQELDPSKRLFVGQKIRLNHLFFHADSINLHPSSYKELDELAAYLKAYPKTTIEIGGHTNTIPPDDYCNIISTARAKSVQDYLISQGIPPAQLKYKGYGKTDPIIPYDKYNKEARYKNQRVEIKILSLK